MADWFSASDDEEVDWPAFASLAATPAKRELDDEAVDRVRYLFPVPDATDWDVVTSLRARAPQLGIPQSPDSGGTACPPEGYALR